MKKISKRKILKICLIAFFILYVSVIFIKQQHTLNSYSNEKEYISKQINEIEGIKVPVGSVDITLYRDDLTKANDMPEVQSLDLGVDVKGKTIILVDDVLYTCRTARAAIDAIMDQGRPEFIQLAVLVDRGHKE